ncbi:MAG TPA: PKD domain-containing protein [Bacteroidia bacterium]|nr:PKD domain-containing protein [Bacteroidia bacterium]
MKKIILLLVLIISGNLAAQDWVSKMMDHDVNFFEVQKTFDEYYTKAKNDLALQRAQQGIQEPLKPNPKVTGFNQFRRWEWFMKPRVGANGERFNPASSYFESEKYKQQFNQLTNAGNWTQIGPVFSAGLAGAGRLNFVRIDPTNNNIIYVGSPSGGLWKSTNAGSSWTTFTDNLPQVIGCTDIAIDPVNSNILYMVTGDGDAGDTYSLGLLKSYDAGLTWNPTGLTFSMGNTRLMSKVLINPNNANIILVASSAGIYRSTDAGVTFTNTRTGSFKDMEFKPGDPNTVYIAGSEFYVSNDGGVTWTQTTSGLPSATNVSRMAICTTPADPSIVYMIVGLPAPGYGTEGFYRSTNSGASFTKLSTPSLGNQQWYDLCIASNPTNASEVIVGGQTQFQKSTNNGSSWTQIAQSTHVDYHDCVYINGTTFYIASDGGLYRTTNNGSSFSNLNNNLSIAQMYGFGHSATNPNLNIQGWQDNGTNLHNNGNWNQTMGGDGMLAFISKTNDNNMWGSQYEGSLNRSTNGGNSWQGATSGISEVGAWVTPWIEDPVTSNTLWAGFINVYKSVNGGASWTKMSTFSNQSTMSTLNVSAANNQIIWAAKPGNLYLSTNGGSSWSTITNVPAGTITSIACSNTDANAAWITFSGFSNNNKVFETKDLGQSWTNLSASIPNVPVNCILRVNNSNDALYIGTDIGVFYKDASLNIWQPFNNGLPNVIVTQMQVFYPTGKIRASTYGRGMWESDQYVAGTYPPSAAFGSNIKIDCPGSAVSFSDFTAGQPTQWSWSFPGGWPSSSSLQNPVVIYNNPGTYSVTLIASNANGIDTIEYTNFITINSSPHPNPTTTGDVICGPGTANLSANGTGFGTLRWWDAAGGGNLVHTGNSYAPFISGNTTYYVDEDFPGGNIDFCGEFNNSFGAGSFFTANDIRGLYFDVFNPVVLNTVDVYSNSAGFRTIEILDEQGNTYIDTSIFIPATGQSTPTTLTLDFKLYPGTGYFIKCRGLVDLFRNSSGTSYPYIAANMQITGSNAGSPGYYYFFYNWVLTEINCNTGRTAVTALDTCSVQGIESINGITNFEVHPNPSEGQFTYSFISTEKSDLIISLNNAIGEEIYKENLNSFVGTYRRNLDFRDRAKGIYILNVSNGKNVSSQRILLQ